MPANAKKKSFVLRLKLEK